ncbi:hypothetical protein BRARA_E01185 [Brassica rapa]|uniref:Uncharacterized protein n=1 Tax=Brassica campestris TaxID=3711 RepID=A0A397Z9E6_BRACM|nr:hypothetical protein BRARA_E01185 [Brassica rapa]
MHHILTQFSGHTLFDNNSACHLLPDVKLLSGHLYYLVPKTTKKKKTKKVTFADHEVKEDARLLAKRSSDHTGERTSNTDGDDNKNVSVMRMKIVLSKTELEKLLQGESFHEMVYQNLGKQTLLSDDNNLQCNTG